MVRLKAAGDVNLTLGGSELNHNNSRRPVETTLVS